jgi:hypothetical protein
MTAGLPREREFRQKIKPDALRVTREVFPSGAEGYGVWLGFHRIGTVMLKLSGFVPVGGRRPRRTLEDAVVDEAWRNVRYFLKQAAQLSNAANQIRPNDFRDVLAERAR